MAASCRKWGFRTLVAQTIFFFGSHKVTAKCFLDLIDLSRAEDRHIITRVTIAPEHSVYSFLHPCPSHLPCLSTEGFGAFSFPLLSVSHLPPPRKTACTLHSREIYSNYDAVTTAWGSSYHLKVWWSAEFINRIKCYQHQKVGQRVTHHTFRSSLPFSRSSTASFSIYLCSSVTTHFWFMAGGRVWCAQFVNKCSVVDVSVQQSKIWKILLCREYWHIAAN